jgi:DNA (cytosine-5)-methyltransferase 1
VNQTAFRLRPRGQLIADDELVVDLFAGGGGASTGIEEALGRAVDIAVNHDPDAIEMHTVNHPSTRHYCESVWQVQPRDATGGRPVGLLWASPDCKHFSRAKGAKPLDRAIRGLAWVIVKWAAHVRPRVICMENVGEMVTWGPLKSRSQRPIKERAGETFALFVGHLRALGYAVEWRTLNAADHGAPTARKRLFLVARSDGLPIRWPEPTHGPGRPRPYRAAA